MDIRPINGLKPIVESTAHEERHQKQQRKQKKQEKIAPATLYRPDGRLEEKPVSNIDVVA